MVKPENLTFLKDEIANIKNTDSNSIKVQVRVVFLTIHIIDTAKECFTAEVYIESNWKYVNQDVSQLNNLPTPFVPDWKPNLQVANLVSESKSETWYKLSIHKDGIYAYEMKKIKAVFYENLELYYYPFDVQDLTIDVVSSHNIELCHLTRNDERISYVNTKTFRNPQEWYLYNFVDIIENLTDSNEKYSLDAEPHSLIKFKSCVARRPAYFYFNAFFLVFLITICSFCTFSVDLSALGTRIQISVTLMLTSVSFKWVINRSLPPISYLTTLDIYSIFGITWTTVIAAWHALYGKFNKVWKDQWIEDGFLIGMAVLFTLINICFLLFLILHIYKIRRQGLHKQREFLKKVHANKSKSIKGEVNISL